MPNTATKESTMHRDLNREIEIAQRHAASARNRRDRTKVGSAAAAEAHGEVRTADLRLKALLDRRVREVAEAAAPATGELQTLRCADLKTGDVIMYDGELVAVIIAHPPTGEARAIYTEGGTFLTGLNAEFRGFAA